MYKYEHVLRLTLGVDVPVTPRLSRLFIQSKILGSVLDHHTLPAFSFFVLFS